MGVGSEGTGKKRGVRGKGGRETGMQRGGDRVAQTHTFKSRTRTLLVSFEIDSRRVRQPKVVIGFRPICNHTDSKHRDTMKDKYRNKVLDDDR